MKIALINLFMNERNIHEYSKISFEERHQINFKLLKKKRINNNWFTRLPLEKP